MISKKRSSNTEVTIDDYVRKIPRARCVSLFLLDLLYPNVCPCCSKPIPWNQYLCDICEEEIPLPDDTLCPGCAKLFSECRCHEADYDFGFALAAYGDAARSGILAMKQAKSRAFSWYCAGKLAKKIAENGHFLTYDYVVPVPMQKRKKQERIINPAEIFAREIARLLQIPLRIDLLRDDGTGKAQHTLSARERRKNVAQFSAKDVNLSGKKIFICDDVLTTGSTMDQCAAVLKAKGAAEITAVVETTTIL